MNVKTKPNGSTGEKAKRDFIGAELPHGISIALAKWLEDRPYLNRAIFVRQAIAEKLERDGIKIRQ